MTCFQFGDLRQLLSYTH